MKEFSKPILRLLFLTSLVSAYVLGLGGADIRPGVAKVSAADSNGVVQVRSESSFAETVTRLESAINANPALKILAKIDHSANAKGVGQELRPTMLFIFGNPQMGTPMMMMSQTAALDLPQKMIVFEDEKGQVFVAYNDPVFIAERHNISTDDLAVRNARTGLRNLVESATKRTGKN